MVDTENVLGVSLRWSVFVRGLHLFYIMVNSLSLFISRSYVYVFRPKWRCFDVCIAFLPNGSFGSSQWLFSLLSAADADFYASIGCDHAYYMLLSIALQWRKINEQTCIFVYSMLSPCPDLSVPTCLQILQWSWNMLKMLFKLCNMQWPQTRSMCDLSKRLAISKRWMSSVVPDGLLQIGIWLPKVSSLL